MSEGTGAGGKPVARVTLGRDSARRTYDRLSRWYDLVEGHWERRAQRLTLDALSVGEGESVLEVGFGTGYVMARLARATGRDGVAAGIDLAPGMIRVTRSRLAARPLPRMPAMVEGDAVHLPFAAAAFDAAYSSFVLELFDTPLIPQVLAECRRVLRPGGRFAVVTLTRAGPDRVGLRRLYDWGHERLPEILDCRPIYPRADLEAAGFRITHDR
ncbi:MAG: methyltransferase domain-containing protein, partial [Gemmatimonadota bacterium]